MKNYQLLTVPCVAWLLHRDPITIQDEIRRGRLIAIRIGKRYRIEDIDLLNYILERAVPALGTEQREKLKQRWVGRIQSAKEDYKRSLRK